MIKKESLERWTIDDAADLYGVRNWGAGYFDISPSGKLVFLPNGKKEYEILEIFYKNIFSLKKNIRTKEQFAFH